MLQSWDDDEAAIYLWKRLATGYPLKLNGSEQCGYDDAVGEPRVGVRRRPLLFQRNEWIWLDPKGKN